MTLDDTNLENRIDKDRREREDELYLLLLLVFLLARRHAYAAVRIGSDPFRAVTDVLMGRPDLGLPGFTQTFAQQLAKADSAGFHRTELVLPGDTKDEPVDYSQIAAQYVAQMLSTLHQRLGAELVKVTGRAAVKQAFAVGGYVESGENGAWMVDTIAATSVETAYGKGYMRGWQRPEVRARLYGFEHSSVLDNRTSDICIDHHGTRLPADDVFWTLNTPPLHFHCRSVLLPIWKPFTPTAYPTVPPMPGFGQGPPAAFRPFIRPSAA